MKKVKLACALSFCFFVCVFLVHAENPCEPGYWQSLQELPELVDATIDESPLDPLPPASASYKIKREGSLLLSKDSEEELIFLKGVGEYYEVSVSLFYHSDSFSGILRKVEENHLNLVRLFVNVGHLDNPNYLSAFSRTTTYHPRDYNSDYFSKLNNFLAEADSRNIYVILSLFDMSSELDDDYAGSAWNPNNNDHALLIGPPLGNPKNDFFSGAFSSGGVDGLSELGRLQRDYVLKVVRETRRNENVIYEIVNEPNCDPVYEPDLRLWINFIALVIKQGWGGCTGAESYLTTVTNSKRRGLNLYQNPIFPSAVGTPVGTPTVIPGNVDIYSEHNVYLGSEVPDIAECDWHDYSKTYDCTEWRDVNLNLDRMSNWIAHDITDINSDNEWTAIDSIALMADTDGLHRAHINRSNQVPFGRDYDINCRKWANIAFIHRASFNTKESLHWSGTSPENENDCVKLTSQKACPFLYTPLPGTPTPEPLSSEDLSSACDDFYWEVGGTGAWDSFDTRLGDAISGFSDLSDPGEVTAHQPIRFRPFFRYAGFTDSRIVTGSSTILSGKVSNVQGHTSLKYQPSDDGFTLDCMLFGGDFYQTGTFEYEDIDTISQMGSYTTPSPNEFRFNITSDTIEGSYLYGCQIAYNGNSPRALVECGDSRRDVWPFVRIMNNPYSESQTSLNLMGLLSNSQLFPSRKTLSQEAHRISCFEPFIAAATVNESAFQIRHAGYGFSNIHDQPFGRWEVEIDVYDPNLEFDEGQVVASSISLVNLQFRISGDSTWYSFWNIGMSWEDWAFTEDPGDNGTGGVISLRLGTNYHTVDRLEDIDFIFLEFMAKYQIGEDQYDSQVWPYLHVSNPGSMPIYLDFNRSYNGGQNPTGSRKMPFNTFSSALKKGLDASASYENRVEYVFLPGEHKVTSKDPIVIPPYHNLSGESGAVLFTLDESHINSGYGTLISDIVLKLPVQVEHSRVNIHDVIFQNVSQVGAVQLNGWHDLQIRNCIFESCHIAVQSSGLSFLTIRDCNFVGCNQSLLLEDEAIGGVYNCIFSQDGLGAIIATRNNAELELKYCGIFGSYSEIVDDQSSVAFETDNNVIGLPGQTPGFVNPSLGDYHLTQSTVRCLVNPIEISPCIDAGEPRFTLNGSTSSDGAKDCGAIDIGYHYPEVPFIYSFPRFKADDGPSTDYTTQMAIYNPTEYTQALELTCKNLGGVIQDFNGTADGNILKIDLGAGETWYRKLVETCVVGDNECIEAPCSDGSITIESDGPLFGQYRIVEENTISGTNSWMLQMQRADLADDDGGATTLSCDSFIGSFGGGTSTIETEIVLHNLDETSNTVNGYVYNTQGTPVPADDISVTLAPGETTSVIFDSTCTLDYGNLEFVADGPVTGEMIYHCQNMTSNRRFSEGVILIPSTLFSDTLTSPFVQIENYGNMYQESYICLKNPNNNTISATVKVYDDQGNSIYTPGTPTPTPLAIPAHGSKCIGSYDFPDWGSYSVEIDIAGNEKVIGHNEVILYENTSTDFSIAGCELDHHLGTPNRFFVPYCVQDDGIGQDYEATWIVIRNNHTSSTVNVDLSITALDGTLLDSTTVSLDDRALLMFTFGASPALLDPGTHNQFVLTMESDDVLSGWVELYRVNAYGDDMAYDSNKLHAW